MLEISNKDYNPDKPLTLYNRDGHAVYWLGLASESAFRCNTYLIIDGDEKIIVDPGGINGLRLIEGQVRQLMELDEITGAVISHQDPDIAGSLRDWLAIKPDLRVFSSPRSEILLPHYDISGYQFHDVEENPVYTLPSGSRLEFYPAWFLHSPMSIVCLDSRTGFMFTSDVFATIDSDWELVVDDFEEHRSKMDMFHVDYMSSNIAARGFVELIEHLNISAFLPQHGSIIPHKHVKSALHYLRNLQCGLDLIYPHL